MTTTTLRAFLLAGVLALAGCGGTDQIAEQAIEEASGGDVKVDKDGDETKIEVGGQELENKQGGLVDGFPDDFPLPDDFKIETSLKAEGRYQAYGRIASADEAFAFYKAELPKAEWKIETAIGGNGSFQIVARRADREAVVNSTPTNEAAGLAVIVE